MTTNKGTMPGMPGMQMGGGGDSPAPVSDGKLTPDDKKMLKSMLQPDPMPMAPADPTGASRTCRRADMSTRHGLHVRRRRCLMHCHK